MEVVCVGGRGEEWSNDSVSVLAGCCCRKQRHSERVDMRPEDNEKCIHFQNKHNQVCREFIHTYQNMAGCM